MEKTLTQTGPTSSPKLAIELALACEVQGRLDQALEHLQQAVQHHPRSAALHLGLATTYTQLTDHERAIHHFQVSLALAPDQTEAIIQLAELLHTAGRTQEAVQILKGYTSRRPDQVEAWTQLGHLQRRQQAFDQAAACYEHACTRMEQPEVETLRFWAEALVQSEQYQAAVPVYRRLLALAPDDALCHFNFGFVLLLLGRYAEAWPHYTQRKRCHFPTVGYPHALPGQPWQGQDLEDRHLFVYSEQGLGDTIQFLRYLPQLKARGARLTVEVHAPLVSLLQDCPCIDTLLCRREKLPPALDCDYHTSFVDLPSQFNTTLETIPDYESCLKTPAEMAVQLRPVARTGLHVGLVWAGNPCHADDARRSCDLDLFAPLAALEGVSLYSLQKGQQPLVPWPITDMGTDLRDFRDTAAALAHVDLVITMDTAMAHLAGALGKPVWLLLPTRCDWRWLQEQSDSPWYPSMRIFRQKQAGDWAKVIQQVGHALTALQPAGAEPSALMATALRRYRDGDIVAALDLAQRATQAAPHVPEYHNTLGVLLEASGRYQDAVTAQLRAIALKPDYTEALNNLAIAFQHLGDLDQAVTTCHRTLGADPNYAKAYYTLGYCHLQQRQLQDAHAALVNALRLEPGLVAARHQLGIVLAQLGRTEEAVTTYRQVLQEHPDYAEAHNSLGIALRALGRPEQAVHHYQRALQLEPNFPEALHNLAHAELDLKQTENAIAHARAAIALAPAYAEAHNQLGIALQAAGRLDEARATLEQAITLNHQISEFHNNLAMVQKQSGQWDEAQAHYQEALTLAPDDAVTHYNLGNLLRDRGRCNEALRHYDSAIDQQPNYADAHWNRGLCHLIRGDFQRGWRDYAWRTRADLDTKLAQHTYPHPRWDGTAFAGQRLLIYSEQGLGDTLQFIRYLPEVKKRGGTVLVEVWPELMNLVRDINGIDELLTITTEPIPRERFDLQASIMDLPGLFNNIPHAVPYLHAPMDRVDRWRRQLAGPELNVGLVWAGRPTHGNDKNRSCALAQWTPLLETPGVHFVGLQKGVATEQIETLAPRLRFDSLGESFSNFMETAAAIATLDLVITVDTAVAHLAGALGQAVWTLLPFAPDWRWMLDRTDSPWYPTMRLIRQTQPEDWGTVMATAAQLLQRVAATHRTQNTVPSRETISP